MPMTNTAPGTGSSTLGDRDAWRQASPHWTPHRQRQIEQALARMQAGEIDDPEEPDPVESFKAQWLNMWPRKRTQPAGNTDLLLPPGLWAELAEPCQSSGPVWVAVEDNTAGPGAAVAAAARLDDGRVELAGWLPDDWDTAVDDVRRLAAARRIRGLQVGASMLDYLPPGLPAAAPAGTKNTRLGLALLRELAAAAEVVHDTDTAELDQALELATVRETATGLQLLQKGPTHLVRAAVWALQAARKRAPAPAIH